MAITYEAPQPVGSSIAEEYGRLTQQNRRAEFSLKQAEAQAAAHARDQANANEISKMNAQVNMAEEENRLRSQAQTAQNQTGVNEKQMGIDAQAASQQREFNYADGIRLQNLQQQRSMIENTQDLSPEQKREMMLMVDPNISALQLRQRQTQMQQEREQTTRLQHQNAQATALQSLNNNVLSQNAAGQVRRLTDDQGNDLGPHQWDMQHGRWELIQSPRSQAGGSQEITPAIAARFVTSARSEQEREIRLAAQQGRPAPEWAANPQLRQQDATRRVNEMRRDHSGSGGGTRADAATREQELAGLTAGMLGRIFPHISPQPQQAAQTPVQPQAAQPERAWGPGE